MNEIFDYLKSVFNENGFRLYMIGSCSRDFLLNRQIKDYDFVTDATPNDISKFLKVDQTFAKFGTVKFKFQGELIDIVTLRKEENYLDYRHPSKITFIKDINVDYLRRDFTINAIYIDENYQIIDPSGGFNDLKNKILRAIGDPLERIKEDPLRILRAERFKLEYNLQIEKSLEEAIKLNYSLLNKLNPNKVKLELQKLEKLKEGGQNEIRGKCS